MADLNLSVDVIIPVYNGARFIADAIESVLHQAYPAVNLIVVDDGSHDESVAIAQSIPGVHVIQSPHHGVGAALNRGVRHGNGELVAFLDADDRWLPDKLLLQVQHLQRHPEVSMVFGHVCQFYDPIDVSAPTATSETIQPGISRCSLLVWRAVFDNVGWFAEDKSLHSFSDWYARSVDANLQSTVLPQVVFERRIHGDNYGRRAPQAQRLSHLAALRTTLARRREVGSGVTRQGEEDLPASRRRRNP